MKFRRSERVWPALRIIFSFTSTHGCSNGMWMCGHDLKNPDRDVYAHRKNFAFESIGNCVR